MDRIAAKGTWGTVEWAIAANGTLPAAVFFAALSVADQNKVLALFARLAETGRISNVEKFKALGNGLWEFKSFQTRFIGDFRRGHRFVVAVGVTKKTDKLNPADVATAFRILGENDKAEK